MSNLLDKASIILTPTAYNNGEALCIKPDDASGDFTFSRNSAATRVNAQGLIENVQHLGSELVTNGNDTSNIVGLADNQNITIQAAFLTIGKTYKIDFEIYDYVEGSIFLLRPNDLGVGSAVSANGNYTYTVVADASTSLIFRTDGLSTTLKLKDISVKEVIDNTNLPRINYEGGCGSWLFEPQSTNLITQSEALSTMQNQSTITDNILTSPTGNVNASLVVENTTTNSHGITKTTIIPTNPSATSYTISIFAKKKERQYIQFWLYADSTSFTSSGFDLENGTTSGDANTHKIKDFGNGWYRCSFTANVTQSTGGYNFARVSMGTSLTSFYYTGDGASGLYMFGYQLEQNSFSTSYIPTSGSTVTRNQDLCTNGGSLASINSTEGTLYFEGSALVGGSNTQISLSDGTNDNGVKLRFDADPDRFTIFLRGNVGTSATKTISGVTQTDNNKVALVWDITNFRIWLNGVEAGTIATNDLPVGLDTLNFANNTGIANFFGKTKAVAVWKEALTDAELTELTTI